MLNPNGSRIAGAAWGALIGFVTTIAACIAFGVAIGVITMISYPDDPSAGSAAELGALAIPLLTPLGAIVGGIVGWVRISRRNRTHNSLHADG